MKLKLFLCNSILSFLIVSTGFTEEITFSGEFTQGSSYSEYHYFVLEADSAVEVMINGFNIQAILLEGDADDDGTFESASLAVTDPLNETWYGFFPLAGGIEQERDYAYRVRLSCPDYYDGQAYEITLRYTAGASAGHTKDQEPNNNTTTATEQGSASSALQISGHLGFFFNTRETYNNTARDGLDYYWVEFPAGRYTMFALPDSTLLKLDPNLPTVSIRSMDFSTILSEPMADDTTYEFTIDTSGTYSVFTMLYDTNINADRPYGGYTLYITRELDLQLQSIEAEDNICGNTEPVYGSVQNSSTTTFNDTDYKVIFEVIGPTTIIPPPLLSYDVTIPSFPPGITWFTYNFAIPEYFMSGDYFYYFNLYECTAKANDGSCSDWSPTVNNRVSGEYSILCKARRDHIAAVLFLLLGAPE